VAAKQRVKAISFHLDAISDLPKYLASRRRPLAIGQFLTEKTISVVLER
jgi:hypothetical protein